MEIIHLPENSDLQKALAAEFRVMQAPRQRERQRTETVDGVNVSFTISEYSIHVSTRFGEVFVSGSCMELTPEKTAAAATQAAKDIADMVNAMRVAYGLRIVTALFDIIGGAHE